MMPLLDVRKNFIAFSGRYDLIVDQIDYVDNGADYYIRSGQRWLDRFGHIYKSEAKQFTSLVSGDWFVTVPSRTVREVWVSDGNGNKWKLKKQEYRHLRKCYRTDPAGLVPSKPKYYAITPIRTVREVDNLTIFDMYGNIVYSNQYYVSYVTLRNELDDVYTLVIDSAHQINLLYGVAPPTFQGLPLRDKYPSSIYGGITMTAFNNPLIPVFLSVDMSGQLIVSITPPSTSPILDSGAQLNLNSSVYTGDYITATTIGEASVHIGVDLTPNPHYANTGLVFLPPASNDMQLEIIGAFLQPELTTDDSVNFWTEEEPFILTMAACRALEISYRNKEGVADWETAIKQEILGLEMDLAESESNEFQQMEG